MRSEKPCTGESEKEEEEEEEEEEEKREGRRRRRRRRRRRQKGQGDHCDGMRTIQAAVCAHLHEGIHLLPHSVSKSPLYHQASGEGREGEEVTLH